MARRRNKKTNCLNCNYSFKEQENFCPNCGQENHDLKVPFVHFIHELFESTIHFDEKIFKTLKVLFLKPGMLSKEFVEGRRVRYVPPFRLYVFVSFVFFILLGLNNNFLSDHPNGKSEHSTGLKNQIIQDIQNGNSKKGDSSTIEILNIGELTIKDDDKAELDSILHDDENTFWKKVLKNAIDISKGKQGEFKHLFIKNISYSVFLLLPILALILSILYFRSKRYFYEYFIMSVHLHVIIFLLLIIATILTYFDIPDFCFALLMIMYFIYVTISLKTFFQKSWFNSIVKAMIISTLYSIIVLITALFCALLSIYLFH